MRQVATVTLVAGILITTLSLAATPADADSGFWRSAGLPGVDAFGVYRTSRARVTLSFYLKDVRKGGRSAAVRFAFTEKGRRNAVRVAALRHDGPRKRWQTVTSANTGHLYVQECLGAGNEKAFRIKKCGGWHRRY